jgi:XRE family transcriptional regulator, regulator of sulfur utilization
MNIGLVVKMNRDRMKLKQVELGALLGVTGYYISLVEGNKREPSLSFMRRLSRVVGMPLPLIFMSAFEYDDLGDRMKDWWNISDFENTTKAIGMILNNLLCDCNIRDGSGG